MADVTWDVDVVGNAERKFDEIARAADQAGDQVEVLDRQVSGLDSSSATSAGAMAGLGGVLVGVAGDGIAAGAAIAGAAGVATLAFSGWSEGTWQMTSAGQELHFTLESLAEGPVKDLQAAAQKGLFPGVTEALEDIRPELEALEKPVEIFAEMMGDGLGVVIRLVGSLSQSLTGFSSSSLSGLVALGPPLQKFGTEFGSVLDELTESGAARESVAGLATILGTLLQVVPPLVKAAVELGAELNPVLAAAVQGVVAVLNPLLNLIGDYPRETAAMIVAIAAVSTAYKVAGIAIEAFTAMQAASAAGTAATPFGLILVAAAAVVVAIMLIVKNWDTLVDAVSDGASAVGNFVMGIADAIVDFFQMIIDAIVAPFKEVSNLVSSAVSSVSNISINRFAEGGVATQPTLGIFGEAGPEALIPLDQMGNVGGGGGVVNVYVTNAVAGNERQVARVVANSLKTVRARGGGFSAT